MSARESEPQRPEGNGRTLTAEARRRREEGSAAPAERPNRKDAKGTAVRLCRTMMVT